MPTTWTYEGKPSTIPRDAVRYLAGDTQEEDPLVVDDEIAFALEQNGDNIYYAAADVCEGLASRFARSVSLNVEGLGAQFSDRARAFAERAQALRRMGAYRKNRRVGIRIDPQFKKIKPSFDVGMHDFDADPEHSRTGH